MRIKLNQSLRCPYHVSYDPERDGPGAIRGACPVCTAMWRVLEARRELERRIEYCRELIAADPNPWIAQARLSATNGTSTTKRRIHATA